jgi:predicted metalloprotease with PDZ domain
MIHYSIAPYPAEAGFLSIQIQLTTNSLVTEFSIPHWRPGRYSAQNYAAYIRDVVCLTPEGIELPIQKTDRNTWQIYATPYTLVTFHYLYYAKQTDAGGNWWDESLFYINPVACCVMVKGRTEEPCSLILQLPESFRIATGATLSDKSYSFDNYLHLSDTPFLASPTLVTYSYDVNHTSFYLHFNESPGIDETSIIKDFESFTTTQWNDFQSFPFSSFHFLFILFSYPHYHGVEHRNSTVICLGPIQDVKDKLYSELVGISSHELLHAWNVYSIRPKELFPYDLTQPMYYGTGLITEGFTTYLGDYYLFLSGVFNKEAYVKELNTLLLRHFHSFGYDHLSLWDSSIDLWVDGYDPGIPHRKVSIYVKGAIVALLMDYYIQKNNPSASIRSILIDLWKNAKNGHVTYSKEFIEKAFMDLSDVHPALFDRLIESKGSLKNELQVALSFWGYSVKDMYPENAFMKHLGIQCDANGKVIQYDPSAPIAMYLTKGDTITQVNETKWTETNTLSLDKLSNVTIHFFNARVHTAAQVPILEKHYFNYLEIQL